MKPGYRRLVKQSESDCCKARDFCLVSALLNRIIVRNSSLRPQSSTLVEIVMFETSKTVCGELATRHAGFRDTMVRIRARVRVPRHRLDA